MGASGGPFVVTDRGGLKQATAAGPDAEFEIYDGAELRGNFDADRVTLSSFADSLHEIGLRYNSGVSFEL
jgi:hypothetical protein